MAAIPDDMLYDDQGQRLNISPVPTTRPDPTLSYGTIDVSIAQPTPRPSPEEAFGVSTATVSEMVARESTSRATFEKILTLESGDTLASLLKRGGFSSREAANVISLMQQRINVRRLQIGMGFAIAYRTESQSGELTPVGVHFKDKANFDHYLVFDDALSWFAFRTVRPVQRYLVYASGTIENNIYNAVEDQMCRTQRLMNSSVCLDSQLISKEKSEAATSLNFL